MLPRNDTACPAHSRRKSRDTRSGVVSTSRRTTGDGSAHPPRLLATSGRQDVHNSREVASAGERDDADDGPVYGVAGLGGGGGAGQLEGEPHPSARRGEGVAGEGGHTGERARLGKDAAGGGCAAEALLQRPVSA